MSLTSWIHRERWKGTAIAAGATIFDYPYHPDQYVHLSESELAEFQPADDKTIHLRHFLAPAMVDLTLFAGRSPSLTPANPAALRPFAAVCRALHRSGK